LADRAEDTEMAGVVEVVVCELEPARGGRGETARWASFQLVGMGAVLERCMSLPDAEFDGSRPLGGDVRPVLISTGESLDAAPHPPAPPEVLLLLAVRDV
jgi:hypothetical protein